MVNESNLNRIINAYNLGDIEGNFLPAVFVLEPTNVCDLSCIMCPHSKIPAKKIGSMSLSKFEYICKTISPFAEHVMLYFMGEPLQHPKFSDVIRIARREIKGKISISTNCMNLSNDLAEAIINANIDLLICCIDHWNKLEYEKIRKGAHFEKAVLNVENFLIARGLSKFPIVVVKSLDFGMAEEARKNFADFWQSKNAIPLIGWVDSWAGQFPHLLKKAKKIQPYANIKRRPCADIWFKMVINWLGDVILCCHNFNYSIPIGDFYNLENSLLSIWHGPIIKRIRSEHLNSRFPRNSLCAKCTEWGSVNELDTYCDLNSSELHLIF